MYTVHKFPSIFDVFKFQILFWVRFTWFSNPTSFRHPISECFTLPTFMSNTRTNTYSNSKTNRLIFVFSFHFFPSFVVAAAAGTVFYFTNYSCIHFFRLIPPISICLWAKNVFVVLFAYCCCCCLVSLKLIKFIYLCVYTHTIRIFQCSNVCDSCYCGRSCLFLLLLCLAVCFGIS